MLTSFRRERTIRRTLRALAKQRVVVVLQPSGVWVVENAPVGMEGFEEAVRTCLIRGWVAILEHAVPQGSLVDGQLPQGPMFSGTATIYRLTESGWMVINRAQTWIIATFIVAALGLIATLLAS